MVGNPRCVLCMGSLQYLETLKTYWWDRWQKEYFAELMEAHSRVKVGREIRKLKVGGIFLIRNKSLPRDTWRMGKIIEVHPERDGQICSVRVRVSAVPKWKKVCIVQLNRAFLRNLAQALTGLQNQ